MITWRDIIRGATRRFLPAAAATALALELTTWAVAGGHPSFTSLGASLCALGLGYVGALGLVRPWLRDDAAVAGRRAVVAGIASLGLVVAGANVLRPGTSFIFSSILGLAGLYFASGSVVTLGLYFPWIARRQSVDALSTADPLSARMLSGADAQIPTTHRQRDRVI